MNFVMKLLRVLTENGITLFNRMKVTLTKHPEPSVVDGVIQCTTWYFDVEYKHRFYVGTVWSNRNNYVLDTLVVDCDRPLKKVDGRTGRHIEKYIKENFKKLTELKVCDNVVG